MASQDLTDNLDPKVKHERELILAVQQNNDKQALLELVRLYRGCISDCTRSVNFSKVMENDVAQSYAIKIFKKIIEEKFNLDVDVKPVTYITNVLTSELKKVKYGNMDEPARKSTNLTRISSYKMKADDFINREHSRKPSVDEEYDFITNELGLKVEKKDLGRLEKLQRRELSGNMRIGEDDSSAGYMTLMDIKNVGESPEKIYENSLLNQKIDNILNENFTRIERTLLREYFGLGQFNEKSRLKLSMLALDKGMTTNQANNLIERYVSIAKREVCIE